MTLKNLLRRSLGDALFGDADLFHAAGLYDLAPFSDLESALWTEGVPNLTRRAASSPDPVAQFATTSLYANDADGLGGASADATRGHRLEA